MFKRSLVGRRPGKLGEELRGGREQHLVHALAFTATRERLGLGECASRRLTGALTREMVRSM